MSVYSSLKEEAWLANLEIPERGLALYTWGNVSAFDPEKAVFAIKPSGVPYSDLKAEDMVVQGEELKWGGYSVKPPYFKLVWNESKAPQGVRYYNIYRSENPNVDVSPAMLVGSTTQPVFVDCVLEERKTYYYKVSAVDNWDNRSAGSQVLAVTIQ